MATRPTLLSLGLWPDKPSLSKVDAFTVSPRLFPREAEAATSTGITATGELYWNSGSSE